MYNIRQTIIKREALRMLKSLPFFAGKHFSLHVSTDFGLEQSAILHHFGSWGFIVSWQVMEQVFLASCSEQSIILQNFGSSLEININVDMRHG